jgi:serine/threonine-protein kinase
MTIGEYRILAELGEGGMGEVFKGADPSTDQPVAVKLLHPRKGQEQTFAKAFENEARALARIHHKNIVKIFRFGMHGDVHYIAMEFVEGTSVKKMIEEHRKLPLEQAKEILRQSLVGLNHIHRAGIVHNDVKPSNILVDKAGNVKLVDFGIVQLGETHAMERRSFAAGTVEYLSPEVIQGSPPSQQSDLYALGVTLYFMLCGKRPFKGESAQETLRMHVEETAPHPAKHRDIPEPVVAILARLLAKDQAQRYGSAIEVLDDLDAMDLGHSLNKKTLSLGRRWK